MSSREGCIKARFTACRRFWSAPSTSTANPLSGHYSLGLRLVELGTRASARRDLCELAGPILDRLMQQTGETAHVGILSHGTVFSIADSETFKTLGTPSTLGRRTPAHCSSQSKVLLAEFSPLQLRAFVRNYPLKRFTRVTICRVADLERKLAKVRRNRYAVDDQEFEEGLKCIGAPVRDRTGSAVAALSIAGTAIRLRDWEDAATGAGGAGGCRQFLLDARVPTGLGGPSRVHDAKPVPLAVLASAVSELLVLPTSPNLVDGFFEG